jgi:hypothetical protein
MKPYDRECLACLDAMRDKLQQKVDALWVKHDEQGIRNTGTINKVQNELDMLNYIRDTFYDRVSDLRDRMQSGLL